MKPSKTFVYIIVLLLGIIAAPVLCHALDVDIDVSPSTLNLAYQGQVVTVHTNIDYSDVVGASVTLDGIEISWWKSDDCGDFAAKFNVDEVKTYLKNKVGTVRLMLSGTTKDGVYFSGTDAIKVVDIGVKR